MDFLKSPYFRRDYVKKNSNRTFYSIFQVLDVLRVDDKKFSLSLSLYFGVVWKEHRLHLPPPGSNNSGASWLPIDLEFMSNLWVRILFFQNFPACFSIPIIFCYIINVDWFSLGWSKIIFFWKNNSKWQTQKNWDFQLPQFSNFFGENFRDWSLG